MRIAEKIDVAAAPELVWEQVSDPSRVLHFFAGVTRWEVEGSRRTEHGGTRVELRIQFGVAGAGIWGWLSEQLAAPIVRGNVRRTLEQLKRAVEHERVRAEAARRRSARS